MTLLLLVACDGGAEEVGASAADYAGPAGAYLQWAPLAEPDGLPHMLRVEDELWDARAGADWDTADVVGSWTRSVADGLVVGDVPILPARIEEGASTDAATVEGQGEWTVWYGTFPDTWTVTVAEGDFAGRIVFARGVGPIQVTLAGAEYELTYYELSTYD